MNPQRTRIVFQSIIRVTQNTYGIGFDNRQEENLIRNVVEKESSSSENITSQEVKEVLDMKLRDIVGVF